MHVPTKIGIAVEDLALDETITIMSVTTTTTNEMITTTSTRGGKARTASIGTAMIGTQETRPTSAPNVSVTAVITHMVTQTTSIIMVTTATAGNPQTTTTIGMMKIYSSTAWLLRRNGRTNTGKKKAGAWKKKAGVFVLDMRAPHT